MAVNMVMQDICNPFLLYRFCSSDMVSDWIVVRFLLIITKCFNVEVYTFELFSMNVPVNIL